MFSILPLIPIILLFRDHHFNFFVWQNYHDTVGIHTGVCVCVRDFGPVTYPSKSCFFCSCTNICFVSGKQHLLKGGANHSSETSDTSHREPIVFRLCRNPVSSWNLSVRVLDMWFAPEIILSFLIYLTNLAICRQFSQQSISAFVITTFDISIL